MNSIFANNGNYFAPIFSKEDEDKNSLQILSPTANYMISKILTMLRRSDLPNRSESVLNLPKIAWKTGTSFGRRDAWSIGFNNNYTVGIWCGNFNGKGVPELNGADMQHHYYCKFSMLSAKKTQKKIGSKSQKNCNIVGFVLKAEVFRMNFVLIKL